MLPVTREELNNDKIFKSRIHGLISISILVTREDAYGKFECGESSGRVFSIVGGTSGYDKDSKLMHECLKLRNSKRVVCYVAARDDLLAI